MSKLSLMDLAFFIAESEASPKHVAGLQICSRPKGAKTSYARSLWKELLACDDVQPPFNRLIRFSLTGLPSWVDADEVDLSQHIFFHKLPRGANGRQDLYRLVASLHEPLLDRSRPLWEVHVIDGLWGNRFALYQKIHHAYADGVTMSRWTAQSLPEAPDAARLTPVWTTDHSGQREARRKKLNLEAAQSVMQTLLGAGKQALGIGRLGTMLLLESVKLTKNAIAVPYLATRHTPLTGQVTRGRQFATMSLSMDRMQRVRELTRSSLNHVALTCLDAALHRYLKDQDVELEQPITIQMPVNLRSAGDRSAGNRIAIVLVELSPATEDPFVRLRNVGYSLRNVRTMIDGVVPSAVQSYTIMTGLIAQIAEMLNMSRRLPPMGNTLVSNVPGPARPLYLKDAKVEEMHPISTLPASNLVNITLFSYAGELTFGLIATDELPALDLLGDYIGQAFDELERAIGIQAGQAAPAACVPPRRTRRRREPG